MRPMRQCSNLKNYLAGMLDGDASKIFQGHLDQCEFCREEVSATAHADAAVERWIEDQEIPRTSSAKAAWLVNAARREQSQAGRPMSWLLPVGLATACLVAVVAGILMFDRGRTSAGAPAIEIQPFVETTKARVLVSNGGKIEAATAEHGEILSVPGDGRLVVDVQRDKLELGARTRGEIVRSGHEDALFELHTGTVYVEANSREKGGKFEVAAGEYVVRVVGTKFSVTRQTESAIQVVVTEGEVAVLLPGGRRAAVVAGETRAFGGSEAVVAGGLAADDHVDSGEYKEKLEPQNKVLKERAKSQLNLDVVRRQILAGETAKAESALRRHLNGAPGDTDAWSLMADCTRKAGNWKTAVGAYRKVISAGGPMSSNRARFMAAVILQDRLGQHVEAASLFRAYLKRNRAHKPLEAETMFRLAGCNIQTGRQEAARELLAAILANHNGTTAAIQARRLISTLE
jgi:FecR protein/Tetratricopeptide repeat